MILDGGIHVPPCLLVRTLQTGVSNMLSGSGLDAEWARSWIVRQLRRAPITFSQRHLLAESPFLLSCLRRHRQVVSETCTVSETAATGRFPCMQGRRVCWRHTHFLGLFWKIMGRNALKRSSTLLGEVKENRPPTSYLLLKASSKPTMQNLLGRSCLGELMAL